MMWPGAEPEKGVFNESYFNLSKTLINTLVSICDRNDDATIHNFHLGDGGGMAPAIPWTSFAVPCHPLNC